MSESGLSESAWGRMSVSGKDCDYLVYICLKKLRSLIFKFKVIRRLFVDTFEIS